MLDDVAKVAVLALIEGITEFLPVSSTGHLIVAKALVNFDAVGAVFEIFIQLGAVLAVVFHFRRLLQVNAVASARTSRARRFWLTIALASAPAAVVGFTFQEQIENVLFSPTVIGVSLIAGGLVFVMLERSPRFENGTNAAQVKLTDITWRQAALVGVVQTLALIPGVSRAGSSIVGAMLAGMNRQIATEFSFLLAIPLLGGATIYKLLSSLGSLDQVQLAMLLLGAGLAALFARLAIDWLLRYVTRHSFMVFGYYRIVAGLLILAAVYTGLL